MIVTITADQLIESGAWDEFCEAFGYNPWMIKDGLATKDTTFDVEISKPGALEQERSKARELLEASRRVVVAERMLAMAETHDGTFTAAMQQAEAMKALADLCGERLDPEDDDAHDQSRAKAALQEEPK